MWNGSKIGNASKIGKWCGNVWIQNGGEICKTDCDVGMMIKMTKNVCGMGCFLAKKTHVLQQYLLKLPLDVTPSSNVFCPCVLMMQCMGDMLHFMYRQNFGRVYITNQNKEDKRHGMMG